MASLDEILAGRQKRKEQIDLMTVTNGCVVAVRANVPGPDKTTPAARYVVGRFAAALHAGATVVATDENADGPFFLASFPDVSPKAKKAESVQAEEASPLGRLADIDVYDDIGTVFSRGTLRRCYVCDEAAVVCGRLRKHSHKELLAAMNAIVDADAYGFAFDLIDRAIRTELDLDPKFGLVTPTSPGSHPDMNYRLMTEAKKAIVPFLAQMFVLGLRNDSVSETLVNARNIGVAAERAMFVATAGVNAYKGLIFSMGLAATSAGRIIASGLPFMAVFDEIARLAAPLASDSIQGDPLTAGGKAWHDFAIGGARREAAAGMPSVQKALAWIGQGKLDDQYRTLCGLIGIVEDTVLFKRAGTRERYDEIRSLFAGRTDFSLESMASMTRICLQDGLSFGGSADLFAVTVFLQELRDAFVFRA